MRKLSLLIVTAVALNAQVPGPSGGRGGGRGGANLPQIPAPPSVSAPSTAEGIAAVEKLIAMVKALPPVKAGQKKNAKQMAAEAAVEQALRDTLNPPPAPAANAANAANAAPPPDRLKNGSAGAGEHGEFVFAVETEKQPTLQITNIKTTLPPMQARQIGKLWVWQGPLKTGTAYKFNWMVDGKSVGAGTDLPAFTEWAYPKAGVAQGKLTGPIELTSKVYPGMKSNLWYYVPAQWDGRTELPVQVWGDGQFYAGAPRPTVYRFFETFDNLAAEKKIPLMVNVFIQPGVGPTGQNMRSVQYDTVDDKFTDYVAGEVLPEVEKTVKLRHDAYSRMIAGESSGAIAAFNTAYRKPEQFSRVLSWIGSFAALQVSATEPIGGAVYPVRVRREPKKNIRVWMQDGAEDQENPNAGSWILQNIQLANSLKIKGYDYHFSMGPGTHSQRQGSAELPESLIWLWRGYDPAKTTQDFVQEDTEKSQPLWRVVTMNRE